MTGSIHKKGKAYYIVFRVIDPENGRRKQKWISAGNTKREADRKLTELMGEVHDGTYQELKKATFKEFAATWLDSYAKTKTKPSTFKSYENIIDKRLVPAFGSYAVSDISTAMLQKYVADRMRGPLVEDKKQKKLKPKTVINEIVPIKLMFKHASRWGYLKRNPAEHLERPKMDKEEMDILTPEEINLFLDKVNLDYRVLFLTAILTGMRRGELVGLQWGDIDFNQNQIHVRRAFCNTSKAFLTPKTKNSKRRIDLSPTLVHELKKHKLASGSNDLDLVFSNSDGKPLCPDNMVKRHFLPALRRAKIRDIRFHDLRHTNVALRIEQGQNIFYISKQIGHASVKTTLDVYGHLLKEVHAEQAQKLDTILGFVVQPGNPSESVRRMLEDSPVTKEKGAAVCLQPLELIGSGGRI